MSISVQLIVVVHFLCKTTNNIEQYIYYSQQTEVRWISTHILSTLCGWITLLVTIQCRKQHAQCAGIAEWLASRTSMQLARVQILVGAKKI